MDTEDLRQYKDELKDVLEEVDNQLFEREVNRILSFLNEEDF